MGILKKIIISLCIISFANLNAYASTVWNNDLTSLFLANKAIIYAINIRTFNAKDKNRDDIIDESIGEERGNFINAIDRLDELVNSGVNTVLLLPVTPVGTVKALGTAGSLFAASSFNEVNPQLKSKALGASPEDEMAKFVDECHKRNLRVIVDLPCCASYDLYLKNPMLFKKDKNQNPIIPSDWTDVRLLDGGTDDNINADVFNLYSGFISLMESLNVDGVRANVPSLKPYTFWKKLISQTKERNPQFLFIAESSLDNQNEVSESITNTSCQKLLDAGFVGYYGTYNNLKNWTTSAELISNIRKDLYISSKYSGAKRVIGNFATHDQISPTLVNGPEFSKMMIWLSATLPINSYFIDGFATGDNYLYKWANRKAAKSFTDDEYYFVHRGQLDIFNYSRKPMGDKFDIYEDFVISNKFKKLAEIILDNGNFVELKTNIPSIFAYARCYEDSTIIVFGNLDFKKSQNAIVKVPKLNNNLTSIPIKLKSIPIVSKGQISLTLAQGEVQVLMFKGLSLK